MITGNNRTQISWYDDAELIAILKKVAEADSRTTTSYVRFLIRTHLQELGKLPKRLQIKNGK